MGVLSKQEDQFQGHYHKSTAEFSYYDNAGRNYSGSGYREKQKLVVVSEPISDGINGEPRYGNETRPENYTVRVWVRTA